jgi:hypothetical protein
METKAGMSLLIPCVTLGNLEVTASFPVKWVEYYLLGKLTEK